MFHPLNPQSVCRLSGLPTLSQELQNRLDKHGYTPANDSF